MSVIEPSSPFSTSTDSDDNFSPPPSPHQLQGGGLISMDMEMNIGKSESMLLPSKLQEKSSLDTYQYNLYDAANNMSIPAFSHLSRTSSSLSDTNNSNITSTNSNLNGTQAAASILNSFLPRGQSFTPVNPPASTSASYPSPSPITSSILGSTDPSLSLHSMSGLLSLSSLSYPYHSILPTTVAAPQASNQPQSKVSPNAAQPMSPETTSVPFPLWPVSNTSNPSMNLLNPTNTSMISRPLRPPSVNRYLIHFPSDSAHGAQSGLYQPGKPSLLQLTLFFGNNTSVVPISIPVKVAKKPTVKRTAKLRQLYEVALHPAWYSQGTDMAKVETELDCNPNKHRYPRYLLLRQQAKGEIGVIAVQRWSADVSEEDALRNYGWSPVHLMPIGDEVITHVTTHGRGKSEEHCRETCQLYLSFRVDQWYELRLHSGWRLGSLHLKHFKGGQQTQIVNVPFHHLPEHVSVNEAVQAATLLATANSTVDHSEEGPTFAFVPISSTIDHRLTSTNSSLSIPTTLPPAQNYTRGISQSLAVSNLTTQATPLAQSHPTSVRPSLSVNSIVPPFSIPSFSPVGLSSPSPVLSFDAAMLSRSPSSPPATVPILSMTTSMMRLVSASNLTASTSSAPTNVNFAVSTNSAFKSFANPPSSPGIGPPNHLASNPNSQSSFNKRVATPILIPPKKHKSDISKAKVDENVPPSNINGHTAEPTSLPDVSQMVNSREVSALASPSTLLSPIMSPPPLIPSTSVGH